MLTPSAAGTSRLLLAVLLALGLAAQAAPAVAGGSVPGAAAPAPTLVPGPPAAPAAAALDPGLPLTGTTPQKVIVTGAGAAAAVRTAAGRLRADLPLVDGVAAQVPADRLRALAAAPGVRAVTADRSGRYEEYVYGEDGTASTFARTTEATRAWAGGNQGRGVGVAVLDTGVSPVPDLAGRLVHGPDLSGEGTLVDSYGHGTVMAGAIAGDGADSRHRAGGAYTGVAPAAHVVAVKVAGRNGVVDVSTVLQAMHWVSAYREQYGIRVLNLSWGVASTQSPSVDPLNHAVQRLWSQGIVVVVAAGNSGPSAGTVTKPGDDPVVLTVGALNEQGDLDPGNDTVSSWSSRGPTAAGLGKPDLVAPGRSLVTARSFGSAVEAGYPKALVSPSYIRGSGTSQAAAVTSGLVALLLAERPGLTPDEVKALLVRTAVPVPAAATAAQGAGRVSLARALAAATPTAVTQPRPATGLGSLEASRGGRTVTAVCGGVATEIRGEMDVRCQPWDARAWTGSDWTGSAWTGTTWTGSGWNGVSWQGVSWQDATWSGVSWQGGTWSGVSWQGTSSWSGAGGGAWSGVSWAGVSWQSSAWTTGDWTSEGSGGQLLTAFWGGGPPPERPLPGERAQDPGRGQGGTAP